MKRVAIFVCLCGVAGALFAVVSTTASSAQDVPGFATNWCDSPVTIPLAEADASSTRLAANVSTARGAQAELSSSGPVVRMNEPGSRVQVDFEQTLFHTQWMFAGVGHDDAVRVDATLGRSRQPIEASSVRGALAFDADSESRGLVARAWESPLSVAEIDVFHPTTQILLTNEGETPIDLVAVVGCPALQFDSTTLSAAKWDPDRQRFVAEHEFEIQNLLANWKAEAISSLYTDASGTVIDDLTIDVAVSADGFTGAEIIELDMSESLRQRWNEAFDGVRDTGLLSIPLAVSDAEPLTVRLTLAYQPDFDDPSWSEGVESPAPFVQVRGQVDETQVGLSAVLRRDGVEVDAGVEPNRLVSPAPGLVVEHEHVEPPLSLPDGLVELDERMVVTNVGDTIIDDLELSYSQASMYGRTSTLMGFSGIASGDCSGPLSESFDGHGSSVLIALAEGLDVGGVCTIDLRSTILPGDVPSASGTEYEAAVVATARSGVRAVRDASAVRVELAQNPELTMRLSEPVISNLRDGQYRISGSVTIENTGDQNTEQVAARLGFAALEGAEAAAIDARVERLEIAATSVAESCGLRAAPNGAVDALQVSRGGSVPAGDSCTFSYALLTRPGARLEGWDIEATAVGLSPRRVEVVAAPANASFALPESPAIEAVIAATDISNNADGTYTVVSETTVTNTGDTPLVEVVAPPFEEEVFGATLRSSERTIDTCRLVSWRNPLEAAVPAQTCEVSRVSVIEPGSQLDDWLIGASAVARSTSGIEVSANAEAAALSFSESPSLEATMAVETLEKLDEQRFRMVLTGTMVNTGDTELRGLAANLDLAEAFGEIDYVIDRLSSTGGVAARTFDGALDTRVLQDGNILDAGATAQWRLEVTASTLDAPGPLDFTLSTSATSPAGEQVLPEPVVISRPLPLVRVVERSVATANNGDGTYEVQYEISARNVGTATLSQIEVQTDFDNVFDGLLMDEPIVDTTCGTRIAPGATCVHTQRADVRPGAALGPHTVTASVTAADAESVEAIVVPGPTSGADETASFAPVLFVEQPAAEVVAVAEPAVNNGDGTYSTTHQFTVTNTGDVPLYEINGVDPLQTTFGDAVVSNDVSANTCTDVSFAQPLATGAQCGWTNDAVVRPGTNLGPWIIEGRISGRTPSFGTVESSVTLPRLVFEERVALEATSSLTAIENNGDGTYVVAHGVRVQNAGDVPLTNVDISDGGAALEERRLDVDVLLDECAQVTASSALAPGQACSRNVEKVLRPGSDLGPIELRTDVSGVAPSAAVETTSVMSDSLTLQEAPALSLSSAVVSLDRINDEEMRIVIDLVATNTGDVDITEVQLDLALRELFPTMGRRVDALISDEFDVNGAFDAEGTTSMLADGQVLRTGERGVVTVIVSIAPGDRVGPFVGELHVTGVSPAKRDVSASLAAQVELPSINLDLVAQTVENNGDGSYLLTTTYELTNDGSTPLGSVRLTDDVSTQFAGASVSVLSVRSDDIGVREPVGVRDTGLIGAGVELAAGESAMLTETVLVEPGNILGPFVPVALASAVSPTGAEVNAELSNPNEVVFVESPALRIEQELRGRPVWNGSGSFTVDFVIEVVNDGDVEVRNLQVNQDLLRALGADSTLALRDIRSDLLSVNEEFDGRGDVVSETNETISQAGDTRLLSGRDTLPPGARATIELDMTITPENRGVYSTRAIVTAQTPAGTGVGTAGAEIEANTLTRLSVEGELGVAKRVVGEPALLPDGSIAVTYEIRVENAGPFPLTNVQVHDQLSQAFGVGSTFGTSPVRVEPDSPCADHVSSSYDGGAVDPVLVSGVPLQPGQGCQLQYDAVVIPSKPLPGPFRSSAIAIASDPFSDIVIDDSTDGIDIDPDGNAEPGDNDVATAVIVGVPQPTVSIDVDVIDTVLSTREEWFDITVRAALTNTGPLDIEGTRLIADLQETLDAPYEVLEVISDDIVVNAAFDGDGQTNLLRTRNQIRSGESAQLLIRLSARPSSARQLLANLSLEATSITGVQVIAAPDEPLRIDVPSELGLTNGTLLGSLSNEEKRLLALGGAAFALFFAIFVHRVTRAMRTRKMRATEQHGSRRRAPRSASRGEKVIDLRDRQSVSGTAPPGSTLGERDHAPHRRGRGTRVNH